MEPQSHHAAAAGSHSSRSRHFPISPSLAITAPARARARLLALMLMMPLPPLLSALSWLACVAGCAFRLRRLCNNFMLPFIHCIAVAAAAFVRSFVRPFVRSVRAT